MLRNAHPCDYRNALGSTSCTYVLSLQKGQDNTSPYRHPKMTLGSLGSEVVTFISNFKIAHASPLRLSWLQDFCKTKRAGMRSEEHTSELQSLRHLVCRLLLSQ